MINDFFKYLQLLEILAFFTGYPLVYLIVKTVIQSPVIGETIQLRMLRALPFSYALVGLLFVGFEFKNNYSDLHIQILWSHIVNPFPYFWALLSLIFFHPYFSRAPQWCFYHSLVFLFLILQNIFLELNNQLVNGDNLHNSLKIYSISLLLDAASFGISFLLFFLIKKTSSVK